MYKKLLASILALACCLGTSAVALAETPQIDAPGIESRLASGNTIYSELDISGTRAVLFSKVIGKAGTQKIAITHVLQKKSGSSYRDVSGSKATKNVSKVQTSFESNFDVTKGATYRVKTTAKITGSGGTDTVTKYSTAVTCK